MSAGSGSSATLAVGNLLFAVTPVFAGLAVGRILPGVAFAVANTLGVVWAERAGGVRLVGLFGAAIQLGIALAPVGSGLADLGVDWRVGFLISAALAVAAYLAIPGGAGRNTPAAARPRLSAHGVAPRPRLSAGAALHLDLRRADDAERLADRVPLARGRRDYEPRRRRRLSVVRLSAAVRVFGAQLKQRGVPHWALGGALSLAAIGMALLAFEPAEVSGRSPRSC